MVDGTLLTLGVVGAVAAIGATRSQRGSRSTRPTLTELEQLRERMYPLFEELACWREGENHACSASGWCHYATHAVQSLYGGEVMSAGVRMARAHGGRGGPFRWHVWNVLPDGTEVDLTGDQFGRPPVQMSEPGRSLYSGISEVRFKERLTTVPRPEDPRLAEFTRLLASR